MFNRLFFSIPRLSYAVFSGGVDGMASDPPRMSPDLIFYWK